MRQRHGVSEIVIREAIRQLRAQGMIRTERGRGIFVADHPDQVPDTTEAPIVIDSHDDIDRVRAITNPIRRAQLASELITEYQLRVTELSGIRQAAIDAAHDSGMSFTEIGLHLGLTTGRISQIHHSDR